MRWAMVILIVTTSTASAESDFDLASAAATAYEANRAKLTTWTIEFRYTVGKSKSLEDAIARRWSDESVAKGYSAFDGTHGRFEFVHSLKDMAEKRTEIEPRHFQSHLISERFLTDGEVTLRDHMSPNSKGTEMRHVVQINPGMELFRRNVQLPLRLGKGELGQGGMLGDQVRLIQKGTGRRLRVHEGVNLRGMNLLEFVYTGPDAEAANLTSWVDLEHGAIPRQTLAVSSTPAGIIRKYTVLDELHEVGDGVWFPYRRLRYDERINLVQDLVITKADFTTPREPSSFQLTFEKPVKVADNARHVVYSSGTTWDLTRLPNAERTWGKPRAQGQAPGGAQTTSPARDTPPPVMPKERAADSKLWVIATIAVGVIALTVALARQWRRRRDA